MSLVLSVSKLQYQCKVLFTQLFAKWLNYFCKIFLAALAGELGKENKDLFGKYRYQ
jgi:hypothetical protein